MVISNSSVSSGASQVEAPLVYAYSDCQIGILRKRYKRFLADIELESGELITAHCPNTGPMTGVCQIDAPVLISKSDNPKRKLAYTWEAIQLEGATGTSIWVGVNTSLPNRVMRTVLERRLLPELGSYGLLKSEVKYGSQNSRIDFLLSGLDGDTTDKPPVAPKRGSNFKDEPGIYIEVKNTTWSDRTLALFPDTVTTRGQKHLEELTEIVQLPSMTQPKIKHRAVMIYFINREDCDRFAPGDDRDPRYGELLRTARKTGVEIIPCRFAVTPEGVRFLGTAPCDF